MWKVKKVELKLSRLGEKFTWHLSDLFIYISSFLIWIRISEKKCPNSYFSDETGVPIIFETNIFRKTSKII